MSKIVFGLCALLFLVMTPAVQADPIQITSGQITIVGIVGTPHYNLVGQDFAMISAGLDTGLTPNCGPCFGGVPTRTSSFLLGTTLGQGTATINGMTFTNVGFRGSFSLGAADAVLPANGTSNVTLMIPFSFAGTLEGCQPSALVCTTQVFSTVELVGQGIATARFNFIGTVNGTSIYFFNDITYEFQPAEVPEPLSVILLGSGLIGLGARLKLRRNKAQL